MSENLVTALQAEGIELLPAELQQSIPLDLAEAVGADKAVDATGMRRDAVGGQHPPHHPFHTFGVVLDLGAVLAEDPPSDVFCRCGAASAEQLHQHQGLIDVRHPHPLADVVGEPLIGGGVARLHVE